MSTAVGTTVFVIGTVADGNREMRVYQDGQEYDLSITAKVDYLAATAAFPYSV